MGQLNCRSCPNSFSFAAFMVRQELINNELWTLEMLYVDKVAPDRR
jgi:hypothetical protein